MLSVSALCLLLIRAARRPVDSFALVAAVALSLLIVINALVLQSASRPHPFLLSTTPKPPPARAINVTDSEPSRPPRPAVSERAPQTDALARNDPIGRLIETSSRTMAIQRALSEYGYGQIKPSGVLDRPTVAAIEKFEREHNMPVTGRISERLVSELAAMIGQPLQ